MKIGASWFAHHWSLHHTHLSAATTSLLVKATSHLSSKVLEESEKWFVFTEISFYAFYTLRTWGAVRETAFSKELKARGFFSHLRVGIILKMVHLKQTLSSRPHYVTLTQAAETGAMWALFISLILTKTLLVPQILKKKVSPILSKAYHTPPCPPPPSFSNAKNEKHSIYSSSLHRVIVVLLLLLPVLAVSHILCALFRSSETIPGQYREKDTYSTEPRRAGRSWGSWSSGVSRGAGLTISATRTSTSLEMVVDINMTKWFILSQGGHKIWPQMCLICCLVHVMWKYIKADDN